MVEQKTQRHAPLKAENVGIIAAEIYFPSTYVSQDDMETFDGASKGKYTIGLGQLAMSCINDREDVNSISLTCVQQLLDKNQIKTSRIGRLEVGTETLIDKSKSVKTTLMQLFQGSRSHDIEGVTSINACYGSTNALFNTINWMQSNAWDGNIEMLLKLLLGRLGIVVSADVAVYAKGSARPTGGIGAIALLIGPNAPLVFDDVRASFIDNAYDFYKPVMNSEYPTVDGHLSINVYLNALENAYKTMKAKCRQRYNWEPKYQDFDYFCFHTPFSKMVQKCYFNLLLQDIAEYKEKVFDPVLVQQLRELEFKNNPKSLEILMKAYGGEWKDKCERSLLLAKQLGNIYTGSLYNGLMSLIGDTSIDLKGKRLMMFSYGSGCAASMFMIHVRGDYKHIQKTSEFKTRLESRIKIAPEEFDRLMAYREKMYGKPNIEPQGSIDHLFPGTFYLTKIDDKYRRFYAVKEGKMQIIKPELQPVGNLLESSKTARRLKAVDNQLNAQDQQQVVAKNDSSVLKSVITNFHKKPLQERLNELTKIYPDLDTEMLKKGGLQTETADYMIENCIGILPLPLGLGLGFKVNGQNYIVPMALEEPSVIAACSAIAKIIGEKGSGFICQSTPPVMIAQIQITEIKDYQDAMYKIKINKKDIIQHANQFCENMVKRGGGVEDIRIRQLDKQMIVVELLVNVQESMGANVINTIAENTSPYIQQIMGQGRVAVRILSNLCTERLTMSQFKVPIKAMSWKNAEGKEVCEKIIEAQRFAELDQYRATTHNKGIMNGIDAVALALGQDWRAIEAGAHSYASIGGRYMPLTRYFIEGEYFCGRLEIPLSVGVKGGAIETNPSYINTHQILGFPSTQLLAQIMVSVGLAQNLAALRALSIEGIQRGHMNLHARNVAIQAGVPHELINDTVEFMKMRNKINVKAAQTYLKGHELFKTHQQQKQIKDLSTFYVEIRESFLPEPLIITILLDSKTTKRTYHLSLENDPKLSEFEGKLNRLLFGWDKGIQWMTSFLGLLRSISYSKRIPIKKDLILTQYRIKMLTILANILITKLLEFDSFSTSNFVQKLVEIIKSGEPREKCHKLIRDLIPTPENEDTVENLVKPIGFSLLQEITFNLLVYLDADVNSQVLKQQIYDEYLLILTSLVTSPYLYQAAYKQLQNGQKISLQELHNYMRVKSKKMNHKMTVLADCIGLEEPIPKELLEFIQGMAQIYELKAVAYRSLTVAQDLHAIAADNLFGYWYYYSKGLEGSPSDPNNFALKAQFLDFIDDYCNSIIEQYKLRENPYFDQNSFNEINQFIEQYYKLNPQLQLMTKRSKQSQMQQQTFKAKL